LAILWVVIIAATVIVCACSARTAATARRLADARVASFRTLVTQANSLADLRSRKPDWSEASGEAGLASAVSAALSSSGLASSNLSSLSPESESAVSVAGLKVRRQRATLTLTQVTLPQLGGFLDAWRRREPAWVCTSIEIAAEGGKPAGISPGGDLPLKAVLAIETLRVQGAGGGQ
jgi:hypothetical protein